MDEFNIALEVRCTGSINPGFSTYFCKELGAWMPGEPAHVEDLRVFLGDLEITHKLSKQELSELELDFFCRNHDEEVSA